MKDFADFLDRLGYEPTRNGKLRLMSDYLRRTPDPERGYALAALTGGLRFSRVRPGQIRKLAAERIDSVQFALSHAYVGDLLETVSLLWPRGEGSYPRNSAPALSQIAETLIHDGKLDLPDPIADWLDNLDESSRWVLLKLITGGLRVGVTARLAKTAAAALGGRDVDEMEELWHELAPPYLELFDWLEGRGPRPEAHSPAPFRPMMLAHPLDEAELRNLDIEKLSAEWKWDGARVQAVLGRDGEAAVVKLYSREGEDITPAFPDLVKALLTVKARSFAIDGELLICRDGAMQNFSLLQQRLNRKSVTPKLLRDFPAHIRAFDLLEWNGEDLRQKTFDERREKLARFVAEARCENLDLSEPIGFTNWDFLRALRQNPPDADAAVVTGVMLKRRDGLYVGGRPPGEWRQWRRDPFTINAVLMYAQRGHGRAPLNLASNVLECTFGVWREGDQGRELAPAGKAECRLADQEMALLEKFVREHTINRFGPVREVAQGPNEGLVLEVGFEGLSRSTRHRSGLVLRRPRILRLRRDKQAAQADKIATLERLLPNSGKA